MQVQYRTECGSTIRPAELGFSVLTAVPDRPPGSQELCPVVHLDDDVVADIGGCQTIETATGIMLTHTGGWAVLRMRNAGINVVTALDLGDPVVKRWLSEASPDGPIVGLRGPRSARAVRVPMTDVLVAMRQHALHAIPADLENQQDLMSRLLDHLEGQGPSAASQRAGLAGEPFYLALPIGMVMHIDSNPESEGTLVH